MDAESYQSLCVPSTCVHVYVYAHMLYVIFHIH